MSRAKERLTKNYDTKINWVVGGGPETYQDGLWIYMTPIAFTHQSTLSRKGQSITNPMTAAAESFTFLAPISISFALNHSYEKYDSIASRAADVYSRFMRVNTEASQLGSNFISRLGANIFTTSLAQGLSSAGSQIMGGMANSPEAQKAIGNLAFKNLVTDGVAYTRVDAPLVYKDSDNLRYSFEFELAVFKNPEKEITLPIRSLLKYSCPIPDDDLASISPPYVFKIEAKSKKGGTPLLKVNYAALRSVSPTYHQPYINGHPSKANLVLEFVDIEPVYKHTFDPAWNGKVSVSETGRGATATTEDIDAASKQWEANFRYEPAG